MGTVRNPEPGEKHFLDPACGSGGMFVQAARYMHNHNATENDMMKENLMPFLFFTILSKVLCLVLRTHNICART